MVQRPSLALFAALALAGCAASGATYSAPVSYPAAPQRPPPGPSIYDSAPQAPVHDELIACNGGHGSNIGEIGYRGESLLYTPYIDTPAGPLLRDPTEAACLSSGFGWRGSLNGGRQHNGLDLANPDGGFVYAAGYGRIVSADYRNGYGNAVEIDHGRGVRTLYAHLSEIDQRLHPGDPVRAGEPIARMGMTGNATGIHLHYEVWIDGLLVDPLHYGRPPTYVSAPAPEPMPRSDQPFVLAPDHAASFPPPVMLAPPAQAVEKTPN